MVKLEKPFHWKDAGHICDPSDYEDRFARYDISMFFLIKKVVRPSYSNNRNLYIDTLYIDTPSW